MVDLLAQSNTVPVLATGGRPLKQLWAATAASQLFTRSQQWRLTIESAQLMSKAGEQICTGRILLLDKLEIET